MIKKVIVFVCFLPMLLGCVSWLVPDIEESIWQIKGGQYRLDPEHAVVLFKVNHLGFSTFVGRFNEFDARLDFDPTDIASASLEATVNMASVDVNNEKFERALRGKFWFASEQYPQAFFKTVSAKVIDSQRVVFVGELTFLGMTQPIELDVKVNGAGNNILTGKYTLGFSASAELSRSAFGLDRFEPAVSDRVELEIHAEFQKHAD